MRGLGPDVVSVVKPTWVYPLDFFYSGIQLYNLLYCWVVILVLAPIISRFVFTRRLYIDTLGIFHVNQTSFCLYPHHKVRGWYHITSISPPVKIFLVIVARWCFFCRSFLLIMFCVCHAFLSVLCSLVVTCWERAGLLALLCVLFSSVFVTFPCGVLCQVCNLIAPISSLPSFLLFSWRVKLIYYFDSLH